MKTNARLVHFYELHLRTLSLEPKIEYPFPTLMQDMLKILAVHISKGFEIGQKKNVEVTDFSFDVSNSCLKLLLNRPDSELSDVTYKNKQTGARRNGNKGVNEAIERSSHVIITPHTTKATAEVRMTMGAGVYMDRIVIFLNDIYDLHCKSDPALVAIKIRPHPTNVLDSNNNPVTYDVRHRFEFTAYPNAWLKDILNNGSVQGVELIENGHHQFDTNSPHDITRKTLHITPSAGSITSKLIRQWVGIAEKKHNIATDHVRIDYKLPNGKGAQKLFELNQLDVAFTKSENIELDIEQNQQQSVISVEIIAKMEAVA